MNTRLPNPPETKSTANVRTLVVDDCPSMLRILTQILEEAGRKRLFGQFRFMLHGILLCGNGLAKR